MIRRGPPKKLHKLGSRRAPPRGFGATGLARAALTGRVRHLLESGVRGTRDILAHLHADDPRVRRHHVAAVLRELHASGLVQQGGTARYTQWVPLWPIDQDATPKTPPALAPPARQPGRGLPLEGRRILRHDRRRHR